jgi:hypothetical protein
MGDDVILTRPGGPDINKQFQAGNNIRRTRRIYDRIKDRGNGEYNFGELTSFFYGYDEDQDASWQDDINNNYPQNYIDQIRENVIAVLSKVDPHDANTPISLTFIWDETAPVGVAMTVNSTGFAYTMTISGLKKPSSTSFVERQKTKSY